MNLILKKKRPVKIFVVKKLKIDTMTIKFAGIDLLTKEINRHDKGKQGNNKLLFQYLQLLVHRFRLDK